MHTHTQTRKMACLKMVGNELVTQRHVALPRRNVLPHCHGTGSRRLALRLCL